MSNTRRVIRASRLCDELGHGDDTVAALQHAVRMRSALRVIHTWAGAELIDGLQVRALCNKALKTVEPKT